MASGESRDEMEMAKVAGNACGMATHAMYGSFHKPWPAIGPDAEVAVSHIRSDAGY